MNARGLLALGLLTPFLLAASPAEAGDNTYVVVRALDDRFEQIGQTCTGEAATPPELKIGLSTQRVLGHGSMQVTTADDAVGGVLVRQPEPPRGVMYWVWAPAGGTPQARWQVVVDGDVLTSDPVALGAGEWARVDLDDAALSDGDGWTGTVEQYVAQHGSRTTWSAGLLTGGCLGSPMVRLDSIGTRKAGYDFEARSWVTVKVTHQHGGQVTLTAIARRYDVDAGRVRLVSGAEVALLRRTPADGHFEPVRAGRTDQQGRFSIRTADRPASWRATWRREPQNVPSNVVEVG